jgi:twinkle protein
MERRGLNPETAARLGIYTGRIVYTEENGERHIDHVAPDADGNVLVFPIIEKARSSARSTAGRRSSFSRSRAASRPSSTATCSTIRRSMTAAIPW